jgi:hypothetical protein
MTSKTERKRKREQKKLQQFKGGKKGRAAAGKQRVFAMRKLKDTPSR